MVGEVDSTKVFNTFVGGLITEAGPLTFPENASKAEENCVLNRKGNRRRRLAVDYENNGALSATTLTDAEALAQGLNSAVWTAVAGSGTRNFLVVQIDTTLHFYDLATSPLSSGLKGFTQDISTFIATGASDSGAEPVSFVSGRGLLFCASSKIDPFSIEYSVSGDSITATAVSLEIRDFDGLDESPALLNDEEPASLSTTHEYNLENQGWLPAGPSEPDNIAAYHTAFSVYPGNNGVFHNAKNAAGNFDVNAYAKNVFGNTHTPKGHYLLNPFYKDRSDVSTVAGITVESEDKRPEVLAFFAGRVWYMGVDSAKINGHIFFSQTLLTAAEAGRCYQQSDPTAEIISALVATDGGVIVVPEIGRVLAAVVKDNFLIIFASNGVWSISGQAQDSGFTATSFQVKQITDVGCKGRDTVVQTESFPVWWSDQGIYALSVDERSGQLIAQSLSEQTIETFYQDEIPSGSKMYARGAFDSATKKIIWLYNTVAPTGTNDRWKFNAALVLDTSIGAFTPWKLSNLTNDSPYLIALFDQQGLQKIVRRESVIDSNGNKIITSGASQVVTDVQAIAANNTFLKFLAIVPSTTAATNTWVFCEFNNSSFFDWETNDGVGRSYDSFWETGYELFGTLTKKQVPYVQVFFNKTETGVANSALLSPTSLFMQARWDFTSSGDVGRWSSRKQAYKLKREFDAGTITDHRPGEDVIISEEKIRGHGKAVQFRFESEPGKDFDVAGWQTFVDQQPNV